ncbi:F-box/kelch-repeat protein At3g06240 [Daucus carota subsp. sativus]|uniref:F-box/kelch-repeat protein At3g06240 n=1 Tax=Daucus carota subsp. sativus TaxID=79200 RepID=UPI0007F03E50|nr:PREDICTED: F-box/kelch-repeat protein At3g06240-like [Daucus carota subsp. sativus]
MGKRGTPLSLIEIPEELQIEIFLKLPVKSLLSCKCVCKHFHSVIENPNFVRTHLTTINNNHSDSQSLVLLHYGYQSYTHRFAQLEHYLLSIDINNTKEVISYSPLSPPIPLIKESYRTFVVGSCNGLICVAVWFSRNDKYCNQNTPDFSLLLWNPVIRQCRYLPKHQSICRPEVFEFGFIPETNDYVVVKVGSPGFDIEVYKMSTDSWTTIDCNLFNGSRNIPTVFRVQSPVFLNGSFHWAVKKSKPNSYNDTTCNYIVYYKLKDEEVGVMNVFDDDRAILDVVVDEWRFSTRYKLSVMDEKLAMIFWNGEQGNIFEIWVMNDYGVGNDWSRRFQISETFSDYIFPLGFWTKGLMLIDKTYTSRERLQKSEAFFYDLETSSLKKIPFMGTTSCLNGFSSFVETLVPVRSLRVVDDADIHCGEWKLSSK